MKNIHVLSRLKSSTGDVEIGVMIEYGENNMEQGKYAGIFSAIIQVVKVELPDRFMRNIKMFGEITLLKICTVITIHMMVICTILP